MQSSNLATWAPFTDLDRPIVMPAFRFKVVNRRRGGRHREELWLTVNLHIFVHRFFKPNPFLHDVGLVSSSC